MINVFIDEFTPCLKDNKTGELIQTEVLRIGRKSFLKKYKESLLKTPKPIPFSEIKGTMDYRGLIAYAKAQGKKISELTISEKKKFYTE